MRVPFNKAHLIFYIKFWEKLNNTNDLIKCVFQYSMNIVYRVFHTATTAHYNILLLFKSLYRVPIDRAVALRCGEVGIIHYKL